MAYPLTLQPLGFGHVHAAELGFPLIDTGIADAVLAAKLRDRSAGTGDIIAPNRRLGETKRKATQQDAADFAEALVHIRAYFMPLCLYAEAGKAEVLKGRAIAILSTPKAVSVRRAYAYLEATIEMHAQMSALTTLLKVLGRTPKV
ncbi:hypothetical protein RLEG12_00870 (plasmid) [Rhizobium leguminosarum bv. trifolii CB782]|nr:hypothetical protein RLEG12_00870 [Rhizobium leguminosarum bv. trifolii CB782]